MTKICFNHIENVANIANELTNGTSTTGRTNCHAYAKAVLICLPSSHPFNDKEVLLNGKIKIGRTYLPVKQSREKLFFDCKVLSKSHALIWYENGKFFIKDTKSSNGTFVNGHRLSPALEESGDFEIFSDDIVQLGVEVTEASDKDPPNIHSGIYTLLKLTHPDGSIASRAVENEQIKTQCSNISIVQLSTLHDCLKMAINRETILKEKLNFLKEQLVNLEEVTKKKWEFVIDEDILLSKIEALQNRLQSILNTNNQLKNMSEQDPKYSVLMKEIQALQEQKELYQVEFKTIIKKTFDDKRAAETKFGITQMKLNTAAKEIEHLESLVNKYKAEIDTSDSKVIFLDNELKTYKLQTNKLLDEKQILKKQVMHMKENEITMQEMIKKLTLEIENKQSALETIDHLLDDHNCSQSLNNLIATEHSKNDDLEHISNNTQHDRNSNHQSTQLPPTTLLSNGELSTDLSVAHDLPNGGLGIQHVKNCTEFFDCPINDRTSQIFLELLHDYLKKSQDSTSNECNKNEQILRHALAILVLENKNLIKQVKSQFESKDAFCDSHNWSASAFTNSLENCDAVMRSIQDSINNQRALDNKESEIQSLNKLVNELEESFNNLKTNYNELEIKVLKRGRLDEEIARNDVQNVLDSMIEKVDAEITQQDYNNAISELSHLRREFENLKLENERLLQNDTLTVKQVQMMKDELEIVSCQNKMTHLLALIPITVLIVSIIIAYLPWLSIVTATKDA